MADNGFKVYVGHLPKDMSYNEIKEFFKQIGPVKKVFMKMIGETFSGSAFVTFSEKKDKIEAIRHFNDYSYRGNTLIVDDANEKVDYVPPSERHSRSSYIDEREPYSDSPRFEIPMIESISSISEYQLILNTFKGDINKLLSRIRPTKNYNYR